MAPPPFYNSIQGVSEIRVLILNGIELVKRNNFSIYHFAEKRCLIPKKKNGDFSLKYPYVF
jgi:hypothetical protein